MPEPEARALRVYRAPADAAPGVLAGEAVAVLGYGNLGRSALIFPSTSKPLPSGMLMSSTRVSSWHSGILLRTS